MVSWRNPTAEQRTGTSTPTPSPRCAPSTSPARWAAPVRPTSPGSARAASRRRSPSPCWRRAPTTGCAPSVRGHPARLARAPMVVLSAACCSGLVKTAKAGVLDGKALGRCSAGCARRPGLELLGQQLADRARTRRYSTSSRGTPTARTCRPACTRSSSSCSAQLPHPPGPCLGARDAGGPLAHRGAYLRRRCADRPPDPVDGAATPRRAAVGAEPFVLSNAGHVASLVNPPGNPKASYWASGQPGPDPVAWKDSTEKRIGSWWEAWSAWVLERSGEETTAPGGPGQRPSSPA